MIYMANQNGEYIYIYKKKKLLKVKLQAEVLSFGAYMFERQSFNNS